MRRLIGAISGPLFPHASGAIAEPPNRVVTTERLAKDAGLALEMAISLHDAEVRRRQSADTKAALYLAFLAAVLPVIGTLTPTVSERFPTPVLAIDVVLLAITLIYVLAAGWYAALATAPSVIHSIGESDVSEALGDADARATMASRLIDATRLNYPLNNRKITYVRLTQAHIFRAFLTIMLVVAVDWGTDVATVIGEERMSSSSVPAEEDCSPLGLPPVGGSGGGSVLRYRLPGIGDAPACLPFSIGADGAN